MAESGQAWQLGMESIKERLRYLYTTGEYSDLDIVFPEYETTFKVHRTILSMTSPVFGTMLTGPLAPGKELPLPEDPPQVFRKLLDHMYMDRMDLESVEEALEVYALAHRYQMKSSRKRCLQYILLNLNEKTTLAALETSLVYEDEAMNKKCKEVPVLPWRSRETKSPPLNLRSSKSAIHLHGCPPYILFNWPWLKRAIGGSTGMEKLDGEKRFLSVSPSVLDPVLLRKKTSRTEREAPSNCSVFFHVYISVQILRAKHGCLYCGFWRNPYDRQASEEETGALHIPLMHPYPCSVVKQARLLSLILEKPLPCILYLKQHKTLESVEPSNSTTHVTRMLDVTQPSKQPLTSPSQHYKLLGRAKLGLQEEPSGSALREKIGDLLKEVRFLAMSCEEFVDNVVDTDILSHTECIHILRAIRGADPSTVPETMPLSPERAKRYPKLRGMEHLSLCDLYSDESDEYASLDIGLIENLSCDTTIQIHYFSEPCEGKVNIMEVVGSATSQDKLCTFTKPVVLQKDKQYRVTISPGVDYTYGKEDVHRDTVENVTLSYSQSLECKFYFWNGDE
ncbi:uncharacterized protein LOC143032031 [Oratosquilla oratoria]|uniref:uncharacterized protein LOC143032031 n=1 Tax=Oratosquilla oratoria TaxID=337810 RepID=UPI003F75C2E3